jgi:4-amino-4-deoxy-L-arabinose transferase-like glycosyltransferase
MRDRLACFVKQSPFVLFALVFLVSACAKILLLGSRELWLDETYSAFTTHLNFRQLLHVVFGDVHPPLFSILLWLWVRLVGDAQAMLRLFSVMFNIASMILMFFLGRRILGPRFGALAAILFAFSPMLFVYSLEVRNYMLFIFVLICLLSVHWRVAVEQSRTQSLSMIYSLLAATLFYIHYVGVFVLLGLFAHWLLCSVFVRQRMVRVSIAAVLTLVFVAPGLPVALTQYHLKTHTDRELKQSSVDPSTLSYGHEIRSKGFLGTLVRGAATVAGVYPAKSPAMLLFFALPLVCVFAGIAYLALFKGDEVCRLLGIVIAGMSVGVVLLHLGTTRYILPLVPLLVLAIARVFQFWSAFVRWKPVVLAAAALLVCIYGAGFYRQAFRHHGHPWQNVVSTVQHGYHEGDQVVFDALYAQVPFDYFAQHQGFRPKESGFPVSIYDWWSRQSFEGWSGPVVKLTDLNRFVDTAPRSKTVWLVLYETYYYDPHEQLLQRLREKAEVTEVSLPTDPDAEVTEDDHGLRLIRVAFPQPPSTPAAPQNNVTLAHDSNDANSSPHPVAGKLIAAR